MELTWFFNSQKTAEREAAAQADLNRNNGATGSTGLGQGPNAGPTGGYGHGVGQIGVGPGAAGAGTYGGHTGPMGHFQQHQQSNLTNEVRMPYHLSRSAS